MSGIDPDIWHLAVEDPDALSQADWTKLEKALADDPALRQRLVAERRLHERLSRLHDVGRGDLGAALTHRLAHVADHPQFVRRVLRGTAARSSQRTVKSSWMPAPFASAAVLACAVGLGIWVLRPDPAPRWISGPATVSLSGGGSAELDREARWRDDPIPLLERGGATLEVAHRSATPFSMRTPQATITVLGTHFSVRVSKDTAVAVNRGLVRLKGASGATVELAAGQRGHCADGAPQRDRVLFASGFAADEPAAILVGYLSPLDPEGRPDPCVVAGTYVTENGPRVCVSVGSSDAVVVRSEPGLEVSFRWWAEQAVSKVLLQIWDANQQRNYVLDLGAADGHWQQVSVPIARLHPFAGIPQQDLRAQTGDHLLGALLVGSTEVGRLYLDDLVFSVPDRVAGMHGSPDHTVDP